MSVDALDRPTFGPEFEKPHRGRRWFLTRAGVAGGALAAVTVLPMGSAVAAGSVRTVYKYVVVAYKYNSKTHVTAVTKANKTKVRANFIGTRVYQQNSRHQWIRIPYVWDRRKNALVYSHALALALAPKATPKPKPAPVKVNPSAPSTGPVPAIAKAASSYVSTDMAWHLARRLTYGPNPALIAEIKKAGLTAWVDQQLVPWTIPDSVCIAALGRLSPVLDYQIDDAAVAIRNGVIYGYQLQQAISQAFIARTLWSKRQVLTKLEEFWGNHFNVPIGADGNDSSRHDYANVIRAKSLGKFSDLLLAISTHPTMLTSLGNRGSDKSHPNENQGRELLELHTVGVNGGYTETDVINSARILTGLSVDNNYGTFAYYRPMHWTGAVKVLQFTAANTSESGYPVVVNYLQYLAHHPMTAHRIALKLATHFVSDTPSAALVNHLAAVYLYCDTAISPVLRTLFTSTEFAASAGAKVQRPFERLVATSRAMDYLPDLLPMRAVATDPLPPDTLPNTLNGFNGLAAGAGHAPFAWKTPDGYPDVASGWLSTAATLTSWNNRINVAGGWYPGNVTCVAPDATWATKDPQTGRGGTASAKGSRWSAGTYVYAPNGGGGINNAGPLSLLPAANAMPANNLDLLNYLTVRLIGLKLPDADVDTFFTFLGIPKGSTVASYQGLSRWQLQSAISLLLDSPYGLQR
jgi:uncharacterized protein (DUF1800 family)